LTDELYRQIAQEISSEPNHVRRVMASAHSLEGLKVDIQCIHLLFFMFTLDGSINLLLGESIEGHHKGAARKVTNPYKDGWAEERSCQRYLCRCWHRSCSRRRFFLQQHRCPACSWLVLFKTKKILTIHWIKINDLVKGFSANNHPVVPNRVVP